MRPVSALAAALTCIVACTATSPRSARAPSAMPIPSASVPTIVRVEVRGVRPLTGRIVAALFDGERDFPHGERALASRVAPASHDPTSLEFSMDHEGRYAVVVYQDVDDDGALDTTIVGYPTEPFGFSNDAHVKMFGPPDFEDCAFDARAPSTSIAVTLVHHDDE
jgi:uncharacterized protein (DUF2141 family)